VSGFLGQTMRRSVIAPTRRANKSRSGPVVVKAMLERFTDEAIKVVMLAQEETRRFGHTYVGTEQLLLGLIWESPGIAAKVLKGEGVNLEDARVEVMKIIGHGSNFVAIPFDHRANRVLKEAQLLGKHSVGGVWNTNDYDVCIP
jgi:ATP-dependent Clp protease ATP-binding subunit ClpC